MCIVENLQIVKVPNASSVESPLARAFERVSSYDTLYRISIIAVTHRIVPCLSLSCPQVYQQTKGVEGSQVGLGTLRQQQTVIALHHSLLQP